MNENPSTNFLTAQIHGRYIVRDPQICHGQLTFRGTRILVADVIEDVASGIAWETIVENWDHKLAKAAIQEAVALAGQSLLKHANEFVIEPIAA